MQRIAVVPNDRKDCELAVTKRLVSLLSGRAEVLMPEKYSGQTDGVLFCDDVYSKAQLVIVIGGDGTIIKSAARCAKQDIPILGVNLGRIGFMSEIEVCNLESSVEALLRGDYDIERRMMMKVEVMTGDGGTVKCHALNDIVLQKVDGIKLIGMELFSGEEKISRYVADGLIISTPTGSTGYNLSAGGPVVNPLMSLFVATAICPHMLTARPAVLPADNPIVLRSGCGLDNRAAVVVDGEEVCRIGNGDEVYITRSKYTAKLIKIVRRSFYDTLIEKLL